MLENLRSERDDLHEVLRAQFAGDRSEDAGTLGIAIGSEDNDSVAVKAQVAAVIATDGGLRANDDGLSDFTLFNGGFGCALFDVDGDDVADRRSVSNLTLAADHGSPTGAGIVGNIYYGTKLNH